MGKGRKGANQLDRSKKRGREKGVGGMKETKKNKKGKKETKKEGRKGTREKAEKKEAVREKSKETQNAKHCFVERMQLGAQTRGNTVFLKVFSGHAVKENSHEHLKVTVKQAFPYMLLLSISTVWLLTLSYCQLPTEQAEISLKNIPSHAR